MTVESILRFMRKNLRSLSDNSGYDVFTEDGTFAATTDFTEAKSAEIVSPFQPV